MLEKSYLSVEQRAGDLCLIVRRALRCPGAGEARIPEIAAAARIHRRDQLDARGECDVRIGTRDADRARFERLAQRIEDGALELGKLVEEQDAKMRQADLAWLHLETAAGQRRHRGGMMRRPERPGARKAATLQRAGDRLHHRDFERLGGIERRKYARKAGRHQRFAGTRRADHQQIVPARRRNLQRTLCRLLPAYLPQIRARARRDHVASNGCGK